MFIELGIEYLYIKKSSLNVHKTLKPWYRRLVMKAGKQQK